MGSFANKLVFSKAWGFRLARHAAFWLSYFVVFQIMDEADHGLLCIGVAFSYMPFNMLFVYVVLYRLVPRSLMRSAYLSFFLWYCVWGLTCLTIDYFWGYLVVYRIWIIPDQIPRRDFWHTVTNILDPSNFTVANIMAVSAVAIAMYKFWRGEVGQQLQIRQEKTKAELGLLKAKLQPQFMFNTLNNLHGLVIEQSERAPHVLIRLSAILSYVLYECRATEVPLEKEISVCKDYIELERERLGDRLDVSLDFSGEMAGKVVAPMLFQPFIDRAFQQAALDPAEKAWMSVEMSVQHNQLFFRVINSMDVDSDIRQAGSGATGIDNTIRRLELLYPDKHHFSRDREDGVEIVSLTIDLTPAGPIPTDPMSAGPAPAANATRSTENLKNNVHALY
jgi:Histidine kinase